MGAHVGTKVEVVAVVKESEVELRRQCVYVDGDLLVALRNCDVWFGWGCENVVVFAAVAVVIVLVSILINMRRIMMLNVVMIMFLLDKSVGRRWEPKDEESS